MSKTKRNTTGAVFATNLKKVMGERGLTGRAAAEIANVAPSTFNMWLSGSAPQDLDAVLRFSRGVNCDFQWLLTGKKEPIQLPDIAELYDIVDEANLSGLFLISAKRLRLKNRK